MPAEIVVTGASGFIGRHLVERARRRGISVSAFDGDLRSAATVAEQLKGMRPQAAIHLADRRPVPDDGGWSAAADNLLMLGNLVAELRRQAPEARLVALGSAAQYGFASLLPLRESFPLAPQTIYGWVKCVVESALLARPLDEPTLPVVWARTFNIVGPGQPADAPVAAWARQIAAQPPTIATGRLDRTRDFLDVRDISDALLALALETSFVGAVNLCSGVGVSLTTVANRLCTIAESESRLELDARLTREIDPEVVVGDPTLLHTIVDWRPQFDMDESLRAVLQDHLKLARATST